MTAVKSAQGRDVSDYQPVQTVAQWKTGDFGWAKATEGTGWTGATFPGNWASLKAAGIPRGAYHFLHPGQDSIVQARHFYGEVKANGLKAGDMLAVDVEIMSGVKIDGMADVLEAGRRVRRSHLPITPDDLAMTPAAVDVATKAFLDELGKLLIADGFWTYVSVTDRILRRKTLTCPLFTYTMHAVGQYLTETAKHYPNLWFAWPSNTAPPPGMIAPWPAWVIWQWSFAANGGGDADAWDGTVAAMKAFIAKYLPAKPPVHKVHKLVIVKANGTESLNDVAKAFETNAAWVISWTFRRVAWKANPGFGKYVLSGQWGKALPKGTTLAVWAWM